MNKSKKAEKKLQQSVKTNNAKVQSFLEIKEIKENCLLNIRNEEIYYLQITPKNISVMSNAGIIRLISDLSSIIGNFPKSEIMCLNSTQSYESNKKYVSTLADNEKNPAVKQLDEADVDFLDKIRVSMATSRTFFFIIRQNTIMDDEQKRLQYVYSAVQKCKEHNFQVELSPKPAIKRMLAIYLEQNVYQDDLPDYDGQQYTEELAPEVYDLKDFVDIIAPSIMDFKHPTYYCIGNTYRRTWAIREYATVTEKLALLKTLGEKDGITLHIYNRLVAPMEQNKIFNTAFRRNKATLFNSKDVNEQVQGQENLSDIQKLISESFRNKEAFIHCAVYIEMTADSLEKLDDLSIFVESALHDGNIVPDKLRLQQRDGFIAASPMGFNIFKKEFERVLPSSSVANLFPLSYSGKTDVKGFYIGKDENGSNIIVDFDKRDPDKTNGHISIFGNSGEGKSWLIKLLICIFIQQCKAVYSIDVDNEYSFETAALGGTNLDMMLGRYFINPLQVKVLKSEDDEEDPEAPAAINKETVLSQHIAYLLDFFRVYKPEISGSLRDILEIMLEETYKLFHITDHTDFDSLSPEKFPILSDLYNTVEKELNLYDDKAHKGLEMEYEKADLRKLMLSIRSICVGTDSKFFNGFTNIPNTEHVNFCISGLLETNENLKNAMYFNIFSFMQHKFFTAGNTVVIADELHEIIKSEIVVTYIRSFVKRGRKKNSDVVIASQNLDDLMLPGIIEYTRPLFSIPTHSFLAYPGKVDIKTFKETANITDTEYSLIDRSHQGHFLYCCGSERYKLHVIAPPYKAQLFGTAGGR